MKVLVTDPLGKRGLAILRKEKNLQVDERPGLNGKELKKAIGRYDAIIIRSGTHLTKDVLGAAKKLRVIGRAGVGVDNVDLTTATKQGIIVMNTPEGNTISTAEHTFSMLLALARNIPQAHQSVSAGEWRRSAYLGEEVTGKILGVVGFGRIGREVTKRASAFGMNVVVFDPFISKASVKEYPIEFTDLKSMLKRADFITVHTPLTPQTRHILDAKAFKLCKRGVKVINCARGGIIDETALVAALKSGKVSGAALDVFEQEPPVNNPLLKMTQVISTPHLGAATQEAQDHVACDVARQVVDALNERAIKNAVNLPNFDPETLKSLRPWLLLAERIGMLHVQLHKGSLKSVTIRLAGDPARFGIAPITVAVLKGLLTPICGETVNYVNAPAMAAERGIGVSESRTSESGDFTNYIEVAVMLGRQKNVIGGTLFGNQTPRIVRVNEFKTDINPTGYVVFIRNEDQPGVVGKVGMILAKNKVNIADMSLERLKIGKKTFAMTVINTDQNVSKRALGEIKKFRPVIEATVVDLN
ncbi:MAG: phosphoglycerate dehydrogenase [Candidatus Omnitrophota bacterium]|nr:phosphoglycerate dehydrogenase [Candidatus Omnitrophota bacterium]